MPLMILGPSLFVSTIRSISKRSFLVFAQARPQNSQLFGSRSQRITAFSAPLSAERQRTKSFISSTTSNEFGSTTESAKGENFVEDKQYSPWTDPKLAERAKTSKQAFRSRQHVNPLARQFQQPTILSEDWPRDVYNDLSKPLFLDIGCSRGGFLIDFASQRPDDYNYLGLEIRPIVVYHAKERVEKHNLKGNLDFVGCNANVDLERLLSLLTTTEEIGNHGTVEMVTIQFPDPHFKERHKKRRVVTPELVKTLAQFMPEGSTVFLQSDIQSVLDEMRLEFREQSEYFEDTHESLEEYIPENPLGVPTEREISVLERDLPVYRATFKRTNTIVRC